MSPVYKFSNVGGFLTKNLYTSALAGNAAVKLDKGSMDPIGVFTLASSQTTAVTFTNIPQTYTHLQLRMFTITTSDRVGLGFNSDTTYSNYNHHYLYGNGTSATSGYNANLNGIAVATNNSNSQYCAAVIDILDYRNTNKFKVSRSLSGQDRNGAGDIIMYSLLWRSLSAITSLEIYPKESAAGTFSFAANSSFALYGINA